MSTRQLPDLRPDTAPKDVWWRVRGALSADPIASMLTLTVLDGVASVFTERAWPVIRPEEDPVPKLTLALLPTALSVLSFEARQHLAEVAARAWWPSRYRRDAVAL